MSVEEHFNYLATTICIKKHIYLGIFFIYSTLYLFFEPQHFLYFFFDPQAHRSFGFCFFVLDLFASVVFLLSLSSVGASFVSPVEGVSNLTNL